MLFAFQEVADLLESRDSLICLAQLQGGVSVVVFYRLAECERLLFEGIMMKIQKTFSY